MTYFWGFLQNLRNFFKTIRFQILLLSYYLLILEIIFIKYSILWQIFDDPQNFISLKNNYKLPYCIYCIKLSIACVAMYTNLYVHFQMMGVSV